MIPADGFYEWKATGGKGTKQPYFFHYKDDRPFAFAGLWEQWKPDAGTEPIESCTIITTTPNELVKPIHDRMPAIVQPADYARWLDLNTPAADVRDLLEPVPVDGMEAYPVDTRVNRATNERPDLIERSK